MTTALKVSDRKVALKVGAAKPKALTPAQYNAAFENGYRQGELRQVSGLAARQVASKLWPEPAEANK